MRGDEWDGVRCVLHVESDWKSEVGLVEVEVCGGLAAPSSELRGEEGGGRKR